MILFGVLCLVLLALGGEIAIVNKNEIDQIKDIYKNKKSNK